MSRSRCSDNGGCECDSRLNRREFVQLGSTSAAAMGLAHLGNTRWVVANEGESFDHLIPADKALDPDWLRMLLTRGMPEILRGWNEQLQYVGMPVGGIGCGQLYLGGDGRLWLWDIFKCNYRREPDHGQRIDAFTLGGHYANPVSFGEEYTRWNGAAVEQGFALRVNGAGGSMVRSLDHDGFPDVSFRGEYPVAKVTYEAKDFPVKAELKAFSPFIPLNAKDSALPATVLSFTVSNHSADTVELDLVGWLQNSTCPYVSEPRLGQRRNRIVRRGDGGECITLLETIDPIAAPPDVAGPERGDIVFADFETDRYEGWTADGPAFQPAPYTVDELPEYIRLQGFQGDRVVQSHNVREIQRTPGPSATELVAAGDALTGQLTSDLFTINRNYITFLISGGAHAERTCLNLLIDEQVVASGTGHNNHQMRRETFDVRAHQGKQARLQVVDAVGRGWGNICIDQIVFTDRPPDTTGIRQRHGFGSMALSLLDAGTADAILGSGKVGSDVRAGSVFDHLTRRSVTSWPEQPWEEQTSGLETPLVGALGAAVKLPPGGSRKLDFAITWYFPDYQEVNQAPGFLSQLRDFDKLRRHYAPRFASAAEVADYLSDNRERLLGDTELWNATWYDSTLPHWFLDRTFLTIDCAATQMLHWFDSGRLYGWEGVDCCPGTCTHVWHYAQSLSRIFPELERSFREITDFGIAFHDDSGLIGYRAENHDREATDGQAGTILRTYREHLMSGDDAFLRRLWPKVKKAVTFLLAKDPDRNGLIEGAQPHTLDAAWYGPMGWISSLYLAAVTAGQAMAEEMDDAAFAAACETVLQQGRQRIVAELFNGEYFIHKPDPKMPNAISSGSGCHIDQVLGQAWAHQVGLPRVVAKDETVSALESLWRYNFATDAGHYAMQHREIEQAFRWYAMPGEAGLLMCTWPKGGARDAIPGEGLRPAKNPDVWTGPGGYFNECMNGFEYQVAAHMIYEGEPDSELVQQGMAITRAIHERYAAAKRNPYNEIECSDHYARSMASFGVFLAACGFEYHGPQGHIGFAPRISPHRFRAPFTSAAAWGTFDQTREDRSQTATIAVKWGELSLRTVALAVPPGSVVQSCEVRHSDGATLASSYEQSGIRLETRLTEKMVLKSGSSLHIETTFRE